MPIIDRERSILLVIDFQDRLMPAIEDGAAVIANTRRLVDAATLLEIPVLFTEQNTAGLGTAVPELGPPSLLAHKMTFDAVRSPDFPGQVAGRAGDCRGRLRSACLRVADSARASGARQAGVRGAGRSRFASLEQIAAHVQATRTSRHYQPTVDHLPYYTQPQHLSQTAGGEGQ